MVREPQWRVRVTALSSDIVGVADAAASDILLSSKPLVVRRRLQETIHVIFC